MEAPGAPGGRGRRRGRARVALPMLAAAAVGVAVGIGLFTFGYARGASYLTDRPEACANCHVMREHHEGWRKSSHRAAAVCNDCHTPAGLVPRYAAKAVNGFFHSTAFTTGRFPDVIRITARNRAVTEGACLGCHAGMVDAIARVQGHPATRGCIVCHAGVGHR